LAGKEMKMNSDSDIPAHVRDSLKQYQQHKIVLCLECGYHGLMGIVKGSTRVPWYLSNTVMVLLVLTGIGLIPAVIIGLWRASETKVLVVCPNCNQQLGPV